MRQPENKSKQGDFRTVVHLVSIVLWVMSNVLYSQPSYENYHLVWSDEFDKDGLPNTENWGYEKGCSVRNNELQNYTEKRLENARVEDGNLVIEARKELMGGCEYTAASLITRGKREFMYGLFEMRAKIDVRKGSWPAFWTLGVSEEWPSNGEVDIMEYYNGNLHANVAWGTDTRWEAHWDSKTKAVGSSFSDDFHIWRMRWTKDSIQLYVDDFLQNTTALSATINGSLSTLNNPFHQKVYILVNQAIGSNGGDPSGTTFPVRYLIDYVRVYQMGEDTTAPSVVSVAASQNGIITIVFSEAVARQGAEQIASYTIANGDVAITGAELLDGGRTVRVTTGPLTLGDEIIVEVSGIADRATVPNELHSHSEQVTVMRESVRLTGSVIGNGTPWEGNTGSEYTSVLDGSTDTYADCTGETVWAGYDFGPDSTVVITAVRYFPRDGYAERMSGKTIEVSSDGIEWQTIATIQGTPTEGRFTRLEIPEASSSRFVRYNGTGGYLNVAEIEFFGYSVASSAVDISGRNASGQGSSMSVCDAAVVKVYTVSGKLIGRYRYDSRLLQQVRHSAQSVYIFSVESSSGNVLSRYVSSSVTACTKK